MGWPYRLRRTLAPLGFPSLASAWKNSNFLFEARPEFVTLHLEVKSRLQIQPKLLAGAEIPRETESRIGRNSSLPVHNLVNATWWHADILGQPILGNFQWLQEVGGQDLTGMDGTVLASHMNL
jgi:hypothetical protein